MTQYSYARYRNSVWYDVMDTPVQAETMIRISILFRRVLTKLKTIGADTPELVAQATSLSHQRATELLSEEISQFSEQSLVLIGRALDIDTDLSDELS